MSKSHYLAAIATGVLAAAVVVLDSHRVTPSDGLGLAYASRGESPDAQLEAVNRAIEARCQLADELIAGRRRLPEVAARFRDLSAGRVVADVVQLTYPGATPGEQYCRQVIWYAEAALEGRPDRDQVLARLAVELDEVVAAGGRLPDRGGSEATVAACGGR
jgi:hypothetical protein